MCQTSPRALCLEHSLIFWLKLETNLCLHWSYFVRGFCLKFKNSSCGNATLPAILSQAPYCTSVLMPPNQNVPLLTCFPTTHKYFLPWLLFESYFPRSSIMFKAADFPKSLDWEVIKNLSAPQCFSSSFCLYSPVSSPLLCPQLSGHPTPFSHLVYFTFWFPSHSTQINWKPLHLAHIFSLTVKYLNLSGHFYGNILFNVIFLRFFKRYETIFFIDQHSIMSTGRANKPHRVINTLSLIRCREMQLYSHL